MTETFRALVTDKTEEGGTITEFRDWSLADLEDGDVVIDVEYSTLNYKDGLAVTGRAPILSKHPMIAGIDLAGRVVSSESPSFGEGDPVVVTGAYVGERRNGGYAAMARMDADAVVALPAAFSTRDAMAIGTAGFTAMLCVMRLEDAGVGCDCGEVLVTGAAGGVGSVAVALLASLGYNVTASTGRAEEAEYLRALGANQVIGRDAFADEKIRPLQKARWGAAVDSVGSRTLAHVLAQTHHDGAVAACGLAQGVDLPTTVMPFILRNVALLGVNSVELPHARRVRAWERLANDLDIDKLKAMTSEIGLGDVPDHALEILAGRVRGRLVVDVNN